MARAMAAACLGLALCGCDKVQGLAGAAVSGQGKQAAPLRGRPMEPARVVVVDRRVAGARSVSLEGLRASRAVGESDGDPQIEVSVSDGPLDKPGGKAMAPVFDMRSTGSAPLGQAWLTLPYDTEGFSGTPDKAGLWARRASVLRLTGPEGKLSAVLDIDYDEANGLASFMGDLPGRYMLVPEGLRNGSWIKR